MSDTLADDFVDDGAPVETCSSYLRRPLRSLSDVELERALLRSRPLRAHYTGLISSAIRCLLRGAKAPEAFGEATADQPQSNGAYGVHQFRLRLSGDETVYRVIVAPANAPISINGVRADEYFLDPISAPD